MIELNLVLKFISNGKSNTKQSYLQMEKLQKENE